MTVADGGIIGNSLFNLIDSGSPDSHFNVVLVGDGFQNTQADQDSFNLHADNFVVSLEKENWYPVLKSAINVYRLGVWSIDSGVDEMVDSDNDPTTPAVCVEKKTFFDGTYCDPPGELNVMGNNDDALQAVYDQVPFTVHVVGLVLNTPNGLGWSAGQYFVLGAHDWAAVSMHEFGHAAFKVADEYGDPGAYMGGEPWAANVTKVGVRQGLKWRHFVPFQIPLPTQPNSLCPQENTQPNPLSDDLAIGTFEGAQYSACGIYRPAYDCKMRNNVGDMCRVCVDAGLKALTAYATPDPNAELITFDGTLTLEFGDVPFGETMFRSFEVRNTRIGWPAKVDVALSSGYLPASGSKTGNLVGGGVPAKIPVSVQVSGPIEASVSWDWFQTWTSSSGHVDSAPPLGATHVSEFFDIPAAGPFSASLSWTPDGGVPAAAVNLDLELYDANTNAQVGSSTAPTGTSENISISSLPEGQYRLDVVNHSAVGATWSIQRSNPAYPSLTCELKDSNSNVLKTTTAAKPLAILSDTVQPGNYTLELSIDTASTAFDLEYTYPVPNPILSAPFDFAPGTETTFTLPGPVIDDFTNRHVFISMTAPNQIGEYTATLDVQTSDPVNPLFQVTLHGKSVTPAPVDTVVVMDRSGSMAQPTGTPGVSKSAASIAAAKLFVGLLREGDRIGIVRFNHQADPGTDVLLPMTLADAGGIAAAQGVLTPSNLDPSGNTSIGGGIILGSSVLDQQPIIENRAIVVLTDGIQNAGATIADAHAVVDPKSPQQRIFAVGLGLNQLQDSLAQIASATNGWAQITGDVEGWKEFILQKLFVQILADVADEALVKDPREVVFAGERRATSVHLTELEHSADFIVTFRPTIEWRKETRVWLEAPDGSEITMDSAAPLLQVIEGDSYLCYRLPTTTFSEGEIETVGRWRVWVENLGSENGSDDEGEIYYSVICKARSDLRMNATVEPLSAKPGERLAIQVEPTLRGRPFRLARPPVVYVEGPKGRMERIKTEIDREGRYLGFLTDTRQTGRYLLWTDALFQSPAGNPGTRFRQACGLVLGKGRATGARTRS